MAPMPYLPYQLIQEIHADIVNGGDLVDDSTNQTPIMGSAHAPNLRQRFLDRLSTFVGARTSLKEDKTNHSIVITLSSTNKISSRCLESEELQQFLPSMKSSLEQMSARKTDADCDKLCNELWNSILLYATYDVSHIVTYLKQVFSDNQEAYYSCITRTMGLDDTIDEIDHELGAQLIKLYQTVQVFACKRKEVEDIIHAASNMMKTCPSCYLSLKSLTGKTKLAYDLYRCIYTLGFPHRLHATLVRAAKASNTFVHVTLRIRSARKNGQIPCTTPRVKETNNIPKPPLPSSSPSSRPMQPPCPPNHMNTIHHKQSIPSSRPMSHTVENSSWHDIVKPYLPEQDRGVPLHYLQPETKKELAQLAGTALRGKILPMQLDAWYSFGFVTARNETQERSLGGLYAVIFQEASDPQAIFGRLLKAVQTNRLVELFDDEEYGHFRTIIPDLEDFLSTPPEKRPSVWRLKQYIQTDQTNECPPCLQRDYGFWYCKQRDQVVELKAIYQQALASITPQKLHHACMNGRLLDIIRRAGIQVNVKYERFFPKEYPPAHFGYDNNQGVQTYDRRLFRKDLVP